MAEKTDLRILKTYHALLEAFTSMATQQNYDEINVNSLCETASIRRATFYKHFSDKLEFIDFAARCLHEKIAGTCPHKADLQTYLSLYAENLFEYFRTREKMTQHLLESKDFSVLMQTLQNQVFLGIRERMAVVGESLSSSPEIISAFYSSGLIQILYSWLTAKRRLPEEKLLGEIRGVISAFHTVD